MLEKYPITKEGSRPGKTSVIFAGIHGNEHCGIHAFEQIIPNLEIESGTVIFQIGNPKAVEQYIRFTEMNLNRMFKDEEAYSEIEKQTYEYNRALELKTLLDSADILLDIHSSTNKDSKRFIIGEKNSFSITEQLPFDLIVSGFDEHEPGGTDGYMNNKNKIGICIECGQHEDPEAIIKAKESIQAFLIAAGHVSGENPVHSQEKISITMLYKNKNPNFKLAQVFKDFEAIEQNTLIGHDGENAVFSPYKAKILFAHDIVDSRGQECFLLAQHN